MSEARRIRVLAGAEIDRGLGEPRRSPDALLASATGAPRQESRRGPSAFQGAAQEPVCARAVSPLSFAAESCGESGTQRACSQPWNRRKNQP
jgi:hypothetical protein